MDSSIMVQQALCNLYILLNSIFLMECSKTFEIDNAAVSHSKPCGKVCHSNDAFTGLMNSACRCWKLCHIIKVDLERGLNSL